MSWRKGTFLTTAAFASIGLAAGALADDPPFSDDLDHYQTGMPLTTQAGDLNGDGRVDWLPWCPNGPDGEVVTDPSGRGGNSYYEPGLQSEDTVHVIDATAGTWEVVSELYVPSSSTGQSYYIVLNTYQWDQDGNGSCDGAPNSWSVQVFFEHFDEEVVAQYNVNSGGTDHGPLPLVFDEWLTLRAVADLDNDVGDIFYNGAPLYTDYIWSIGVSGTGNPTLQCLDWFVTFGEQYFDNAVVRPVGAGPEIVCVDTFQVNRGIESETGVGDTCDSDDEYWVWQPDAIAATIVAPINLVLNGEAVADTANEIRFVVEVKATPNAATGVVMRIELFDFDTNSYRTANNFPNIPITDTVFTVTVTSNPSALIGPNGEVRARLSFLRPQGVPPFWRPAIDLINWEIE